MNSYKIHPNVSDVEVMRVIHQAGARCLRLIPGHKAKTLFTDKPINAARIEMRPEDWLVRQEEEYRW